MLSQQVKQLETENITLRQTIQELEKKMNAKEVLKPKSCKYCKNYIQHYMKGGKGSITEYTPCYAGHCIAGVPVKHGGKRNPVPDDSCPYFELRVEQFYSKNNKKKI